MKSKFFKVLIKARKIFSNTGIGKIPGLILLYNKIFRFSKPEGVVLTQVQGFNVFINADDIGMSQSLLESGVYEEYETEIITSLVEPGMKVVNVGANFGYYTLISSRLVGSHGQVYAFEPEPNNFNLLLKNIQNNDITNVVANNCAVGSYYGEQNLFTDSKNVGNPSLSELNVPNVKDKITVPVVTLDEYFKNVSKQDRIDVIHMDVQGSEGLVLDGAKNILKKNNLLVLMEFWPFGLSNMGTDPKIFLQNLKEDGFSVQLINEANKSLDFCSADELIKLCSEIKNGRGFVNVLLRK